MKFKLNIVMDFVLGTFFVFGICFVWARFFLHDLTTSVVVCGIITFFAVGLYCLILNKRQLKKQISAAKIKNASDIANYFMLCTKQETLQEFLKILSKTAQAKIKSDFLITENFAIRPIYNTTHITDKDVLTSFAKIKNTSLDKIVICCKNCTQDAKDIAKIIKTKKVEILTELDAYNQIFEPASFVVEATQDPPKKFKEKLKDYSKVAFNKQRTKNYLLVALAMLFGSFVLRYNIYYLVFATLATILALYSKFNTKFNPPKNNASKNG